MPVSMSYRHVCRSPAEGGEAVTKVLSREEVEHWVKARVGSSQAEGDDHRLLHIVNLLAGSVFAGLKVEMQRALYMIGHKTDQESHHHHNDHPNGLVPRVTLLVHTVAVSK